jgi:hypothetical protein
MRWRHHETRQSERVVWVREPRTMRMILAVRASDAAREAGAVLRDVVPVPGWVSSVAGRDGKTHVCGSKTQGARPAWIWTGDIA